MALLSTYPIVHLDKKPKANGIDAGIKGLDLAFPQKSHRILVAFTESMILKGFKRFLSHHSDSDINKLSYRELLLFVKAQAVIMHPTKLKQTISAIKFYYERTLGRDKMFFVLVKNKKVSLLTLYLPFYDLKELINGIDSPGDKLLLFLVYNANFRLSKICTLPKDAHDLFQQQLRLTNIDVRAIQYFQGLVAECNKQYHQNTFLFENNGHAHNTSTLRCKLFRILGHYRMEDIYRKQYQQILKHTDFSVRTRAMYLNAFMKLLKHFNYKHPAFITDEDIWAYRASHRNKSAAYMNILVSSFKFFFEKVHKRTLSQQCVVRSHGGLHLPDYFSESEMAAMLGTTDNLKHKLLLELGCISSLRQPEIQNLRLVDIDFKRNRLLIKDPNCKHYRCCLISQHLKALLKTYLTEHKPKTYLFEGLQPGMKYSTTSMSGTLKRIAKASGIQRKVHLHMLGHSFATHSPEDNKDIWYMQELPLPRYESIKASERYTHFLGGALLNLNSPFNRVAAQTSSKPNRNHSPP